jgi:hypothetical protein
MPPRRLRVAIEADPHADAEAAEPLEHRPTEQGAVGLDGDVYPRGYPRTKRADQVGQPFRSGEKRLAAVQDHLDAGEVVRFGVLGDAADGRVRHRPAHPLGQVPPRLIRHLVHVTVRTR